MRLASLVATFLWVGTVQAETLSLSHFLGSVRESNQDYRASRESHEASQLNAVEGTLVYSPTLFSTLQYSDDAKPSFIPSFNYQKILTQTYSLGVAQQTPFGLQGKLYYSLSETEYKGLVSPYSEGRPTLELTQSLWRNDFGREVRAQVQSMTAAVKAAEHGQAFQLQSILVQAEASYWRLALARQTVDIAQENLNRAEKLFAWAKRRMQLSLADRSDFLQAQTVLQSRKLELIAAKDELRSASLAFNSARGVDSDQVTETLEPLSKELIAGLKVPDRISDRQDVLAAEQQKLAAEAQGVLGRERNQPTLEVFGTYAFNSRQPTKDEAWVESWSDTKPTKVVGLRFSSPLAFGKLSDLQDGYAKQIKAADLAYQRKRFLQEQDWRDLALHFKEAKERLELAESLEKAQKEKLDHERSRHELGRSTLFQVLTFESDYLNAQSLRLRTLNELLQLAAQMKLYGVN